MDPKRFIVTWPQPISGLYTVIDTDNDKTVRTGLSKEAAVSLAVDLNDDDAFEIVSSTQLKYDGEPERLVFRFSHHHMDDDYTIEYFGDYEIHPQTDGHYCVVINGKVIAEAMSYSHAAQYAQAKAEGA